MNLLKLFAEKLMEETKNDERVIFINSMKPFVKANRRHMLDECTKILQLAAFLEMVSGKKRK